MKKKRKWPPSAPAILEVGHLGARRMLSPVGISSLGGRENGEEVIHCGGTYFFPLLMRSTRPFSGKSNTSGTPTNFWWGATVWRTVISLVPKWYPPRVLLSGIQTETESWEPPDSENTVAFLKKTTNPGFEHRTVTFVATGKDAFH